MNRRRRVSFSWLIVHNVLVHARGTSCAPFTEVIAILIIHGRRGKEGGRSGVAKLEYILNGGESCRIWLGYLPLDASKVGQTWNSYTVCVIYFNSLRNARTSLPLSFLLSGWNGNTLEQEIPNDGFLMARWLLGLNRGLYSSRGLEISLWFFV